MDMMLEQVRKEFWRLTHQKRHIDAYQCVEEISELKPLYALGLINCGMFSEKALHIDLIRDISKGDYKLRDVACLVDAVPEERWREKAWLDLLMDMCALKASELDRTLMAGERLQLTLTRVLLWHGDYVTAEDIAKALGDSLLDILVNDTVIVNERRLEMAAKVACLAGETLVLAGEERLAGSLAEALKCRQLIKKDGDIAVGIGQISFRLSRFQEAIDRFSSGLKLGCSTQLMRARARWGMGNCGLLLREYTRKNFRLYALERGIRAENPSGLPRWRREKDAIVLIRREQGLGEEIFFLRFIALLVKRYKNTEFVIETSACLAPLVEQWYPGLRQLEMCDTVQKEIFTHTISLGMLPFYLDEEDLRADVSSIEMERARIQCTYKSELGDRGGMIRIGLIWRTGKTIYAKQKSIGLQLVEQAVSLSGVSFISLQHDLDSMEKQACKDYQIECIDSANEKDWMLLYEVLSSLDCVITCSTAVAHLSATLGIKTKVLLPRHHTNGWMWNHNEHGFSDWYSKAMIYKQSDTGTWATAIDSALEGLKDGL